MSYAYDGDESRHVAGKISQYKKGKHKELGSYTHFEEVLERVNPFGTFQIFACICILFATIEWAGNYTFVSVLGSIEPDWSCETKHNRTVVIKAPTDEAQCQFIKANCTKLTAIKSSVEFYSLVAQWKSICDESDRPKLVQLIQSIGGFIGSFVGGHFGDHFGRKKFFFTGQLCVVITSVMATATTSWYTYSICLGLNAILYGSIEVTSLTLMMEYTSNKYRLIPNACFQWPLAYTVIALIAFLTKDWQYYFIFLNLVTSPIIVGFMLFYESPRWLVASNQLERACEVLNDIAHRRWNNANIKLTTNDLNLIPRDTTNKRPFYNVYHLFCTRRLFKQTFMQLLSMFTYGLISSTYFFSKKGMHDSAIMFTFLHGAFRIAVPPLVVFLDFKFYNFGRKMQLVGSLAISTVCFAIIIVLILLHVPYYHTAVTICIVIASMANESVFWMNIVQITSQRYPTVIRCIAFGCIHAFKHVGMIIGVWIMIPLLSINPLWTFIIPEIFIIVTMLCGIALQPETKGKVLTDRLIESHFGRLQNEIPKAIMRISAGHRFNQVTVRERLQQQGRFQVRRLDERRDLEMKDVDDMMTLAQQRATNIADQDQQHTLSQASGSYDNTAMNLIGIARLDVKNLENHDEK